MPIPWTNLHTQSLYELLRENAETLNVAFQLAAKGQGPLMRALHAQALEELNRLPGILAAILWPVLVESLSQVDWNQLQEVLLEDPRARRFMENAA